MTSSATPQVLQSYLFIHHLRDRMRAALPPDKQRAWAIFALPIYQEAAIHGTAQLIGRLIEIKHAHTLPLAVHRALMCDDATLPLEDEGKRALDVAQQERAAE